MNDPIERIAASLHEARLTEPFDPTAAALATASREGVPSVRFVLVKEVGPAGLVFYTNSLSRKGREMAANPVAALAFHWHTRGEQVRVEGTLQRVTESESDRYFAARPRESQLGAWASDQSEPIATREALDAKFRDAAARYEGQPVSRPPHWVGFRLTPARIEFWSDRSGRLHDRTLYLLEDSGWRVTRLQP